LQTPAKEVGHRADLEAIGDLEHERDPLIL